MDLQCGPNLFPGMDYRYLFIFAIKFFVMPFSNGY